VSNSIFLTTYGAEFLPLAWIAALPLGFLTVSFYNYFLPKWGCLRLFCFIATAIASVNVLCSFWMTKFPPLTFFFYVWKEVYIMLMFQQLWSLIHTVATKERAQYLYGFLFGVGALGSIFGSSLPSFFAVFIGSEKLLLATPFLYALLILFYRRLAAFSPTSFLESNRPSFYQGAQQVFHSKQLRLILYLVLFMQVSVSVIDFQFNQRLSLSVLDKDLRTAYFGKIMGCTHLSTLCMQLFGSYLFIRFLKVKGCHLLIPFTLLANTLSFLLFPAFGLITFSFAVVKTFDFSLFSIVKEMLYIPLKLNEKFQAKAFIDVFAYRASKALAAAGIFLFSSYLSWMHSVLLLIWSGLILWTLERKVFFDKKTATE
jgi:AAA family ATP:ADP antiporter